MVESQVIATQLGYVASVFSDGILLDTETFNVVGFSKEAVEIAYQNMKNWLGEYGLE
jgi:hypothetical protein